GAHAQTAAQPAADTGPASAGPASAGPASAGPASASNEIIVTGYRFLDEDTSGITNLPLPVEKVPQSISLVNNDFAKAADLKNMGEIAQHTTGALWASYSPSYGNQFWLRGFSAGYAIDGLTVGDQITEPDPAILERYEVVKGPASVVYGAQSPGGVVNLVSKTASPDTPNYLEALGGSWGRWRVEGQVADSLNASGTIRAIAVAAHEEGGSFVDFVKLNKTVAYGGLDFDLSERLTGYVRVSYQRTEDTPYNGIPTYPDGTPVPVSRSFFMGGTDYDNLTQATRVNTGLTWRPSDEWTFDLKAIYQYTTHDGQNVYPYGYIAEDGSFPVGGEYFDAWHVNDSTVGGTATRKLDDIGLTDSYIVASVRYQHYRYYISERNFSAGAANINDGERAVSDLYNSLTPVPGGYEQDQRMNYLTGSVQAVVKVASPLTFIGGIAYSKPEIDMQVYNGAWQNLDPGQQVNYRGALVYEPVDGLNLYASYSESYQPNLRIDINHDVLPPVSGKQYEVGAKYLPNRQILLTAALFEIRESNVAVYDTMVDGEALYKASGVRHRGVELEATGQVTDQWQVKGGLALLDPKVTNDPENPVNVGETRPWLPRVTANLYTSYDFDNGISVSGGARYVGSVKTYDRSSTPTPDISAYTLFDAAVGYSFDDWRLQMNLKNIFDKHYYVSTPIFQSLSSGLYPGEPRSVTVSMRRNF
ncbi:TonB-dependent siderophore receptor, partial [Nitrospirillum amazonense]|uniref:TonB-dependent siderophore receptor n=1 Tax=Nitrospirillum amazonense TaxID=28077 RepID=UPI002DD430DA